MSDDKFWRLRGKKVVITGTLLPAGTSANGNYYPEEVLKKAVEDAQEMVASERMLGTFDSRNFLRLSEVSHVVKKLEFRDGAVHAKVEVLDTPNGRLLKAQLEAGASVNFVPDGFVKRRSGDRIEEISLRSVAIEPKKDPL